jgi:single-strand DNA-binding protein
MPSFNKVMLIGNLTRDPKVKQLPSQMVVAEFGMAMNRRYRTAAGEDKEEVCFVDCAAFGKQAETIVQWCKKGKPLFVEGRLKYDTWEDRAGGAKRSKLSVVVENFQFLGSRDDAFNGGNLPFGHSNANGGGYPGNRDRDRDAESAQTTMFDSKEPAGAAAKESKDTRPERRPNRSGRAPARQTAEQPFGEEKTFQEADIPF